ncbi:rRNA maturation RNAse YbeY [Pseudomonas grimontii]|uniref:rRNA maturation RNAse YbeY n=1 Tax=Pseudomonas grimontii TaxID=129847 RepID=A0A5C5PLV5_9PSED|nr:rRNA maturation RNAse YbeY [Pseudomonas grimontii]
MGDRAVSQAARDQHPQEDEMGFYRAHSVFQFGVVAR